MSRYRYSASLSWGGDAPTAEVEVEVSFSVAWGSPETGRGYMADPAKYDPGSPDVVEDIKLLTVDGRSRPWDMGFGFLSDDEFERDVIEKLEVHHDDMIAEAQLDEMPDPDAQREERREWAVWRDGYPEDGGME